MLNIRTLWKRLLLEEDHTDGMPQSVVRAVRAQQDKSERLIGWIQLVLVVLFGALYTAAPKTHMTEFWMAPVPIALSLYLVFTIVRVFQSYRISLPDWYLGLSGLVDIALLMVLIWSFHVQYEQPPAFYLKAPTMLYVFIFIALRALRFEPRYVLRTGLAAALGWLLLVIYALQGSPDNTMPVTRDYVEYLTQNRVLLGGELDKILSILVVTGLLTAALIFGRRTLIQALSESHSSAELSRFFDPEIANRIKQGADQAAADEVEASVLYIDIRDFTKLSEDISPAELITILGDYQGRMTPAINEHGGIVERFTGDGVMASFGAATKLAAPQKAALDAVEDILRSADAWSDARRAAGQDPVRIGVAVTTGRLIIGAVGGGGKMEYTLVGEPANRAAKIEKLNKTMGLRALADQRTVDMASQQGWVGTIIARHQGVVSPDMDQPIDLVVLDDNTT